MKRIHNIIKSTHIEQPYNAMLHFERKKKKKKTENEKQKERRRRRKKRTQTKAFTHS